MPVSPAERQYILTQVNTLASEQISLLWDHAEALTDIDFAAFVRQAFPEVVTPFAATAADLAATWYDESPSPTNYIAKPGALPDPKQLESSADWALGADGREAVGRMQGTAQRAIFDSARDTIVSNVESESGSKWVRYASANACAFCALMATREAIYVSEHSALRVVGRGKDFSHNFNADGTRKAGGQAGGVKLRGTQKLGDKYHDDCHCVAVEVRPGGRYEPPAHVRDWKRAYQDAFDAVPDGTPYDNKNSVLKAVLSNMRSDLESH
jgi:hypothetical protein